ncbi:MAG: phosphate/phosphite/phosphonate ABC transporter substrate-binding protein [Rhodospirillaceae bacterium]|nr:phosphate/phosphite/phosphonate ABC transporter substrate-binding protein [Rhodospirillaceae bacterium]
MKHSQLSRRAAVAGAVVAAIAAAAVGPIAGAQAAPPLTVVLIPADGGTESGTKADFAPVFDAVARSTGLTFELYTGQSYNAVVEAMCNRSADIAFFGPVSYLQARGRGCAELLAVAVENGASTYFAGIFARADSPLKDLQDLRGRSVAFGDVNSASSFVFPVAMLLDAGLDPAGDLAAVRLTGGHAAGLAALAQGQVDAACLSFESFAKAVDQGAIRAESVRILGRSPPIPNPPLGIGTHLPAGLKAQLKAAFATVHQAPGVTADMVRGYGGKRVDAYDTTFSDSQFDVAARAMLRVDDRVKTALLAKASQR